ncbi:hypothetical protein ACMYSQ_006334 [Aspergillus niger]
MFWRASTSNSRKRSDKRRCSLKLHNVQPDQRYLSGYVKAPTAIFRKCSGKDPHGRRLLTVVHIPSSSRLSRAGGVQGCEGEGSGVVAKSRKSFEFLRNNC